jgi:hypothetical protein
MPKIFDLPRQKTRRNSLWGRSLPGRQSRKDSLENIQGRLGHTLSSLTHRLLEPVDLIQLYIEKLNSKMVKPKRWRASALNRICQPMESSQVLARTNSSIFGKSRLDTGTDGWIDQSTAGSLMGGKNKRIQDVNKTTPDQKVHYETAMY